VSHGLKHRDNQCTMSFYTIIGLTQNSVLATCLKWAGPLAMIYVQGLKEIICKCATWIKLNIGFNFVAPLDAIQANASLVLDNEFKLLPFSNIKFGIWLL
jgi:hypothetical protein